MAFVVLWTFNAHVATLNLRTISLWAGHKLFSFWSMSGALKKDGTPHDLQIWFSHSKAKNPNCPLFMHKCPCVSFLFIVFSMVWLVTLFFFFVLFCIFVFFFWSFRNTRGFVLYFLIKKYTSMPYIEGISVRYK